MSSIETVGGRGKRSMWWRVIAGALALATVAAACGNDDDTTAATGGDGAGGADDSPAEVSFLKPNPWDASTGAGYFSALEEGYFDEQGVVPDTLVGTGGQTGVTGIVSGSAQIAQSNPDEVVNAVAQGGDIVAVWQWLDGTNMWKVLANSSAGISEVSDLRGKRLGILGAGSTTEVVIEVLLAQEGMTLEDVEIVSLGCCTAQYQSLVSGDVDAIGSWDAQIEQVKQTARSEGETEFLDQLIEFTSDSMLGDVMITTREFYEQNRDTLVRWFTAFRQGLEFQFNQPEASLANAAMHVEGVAPDSADDLTIVKLRAATYVLDGRFDHQALKNGLDIYHDLGVTLTPTSMEEVQERFPNDIVDAVDAALAES